MVKLDDYKVGVSLKRKEGQFMIYAFLVFMGGCFYGILSTIVKFAYAAGYSVNEVIGAQFFFGFILQMIVVLLFSRKKVSWKQAGLLMLVGTTMSGTGIFYGASLVTVPASIAIVLLFQFTWVGIIIEAIASRKRPSKGKVISIIVLLIGTLLSANIIDGGFDDLTLWGVGLGLLSAVTYALFIFVSGKVATNVPALNRTMMMSMGGMLLVFVIYPPTFLVDGALLGGLWKYGLLLALFGTVISGSCLMIGAPKIGSGLATILSSSELPVAVISSALVLKESVSIMQWLGVALIFVGIIIPQLRVFRERDNEKRSTA